MGRLLLRFFVGGLVGLLVWLCFEPFKPPYVANPETQRRLNVATGLEQPGMGGAGTALPGGGAVNPGITSDDVQAAQRYNAYLEAWASWEKGFIYLLCAAIGAAVGGLDGFSRGGKRHTLKGIGLGLFFGVVGGPIGYGIGGSLAAGIFGANVFESGMVLMQMPARIIAFTPIGLLLGAAIGGSSINLKKTIQGAIGGGLGGLIAGALFDPLTSVFGHLLLANKHEGEVGAPGRALMALLLGALIALFIGLVERIARSAWLRLQLGRNEGKEWSIDSAQTFIGRSEGAHVPLFGDPNVAPVHCSIQRQGPNYVLVDGGSPMGTYLNGQRIQSALLAPGSQIQVGGFVLTFLVKNQAAPYRGPEAYPGQAYPYGGAPVQPGPAPQAPAPMPNPGVPNPGMTGAAPYAGAPMPGAPMQGAPIPGAPMPGAPTQVMPAAGGGMPTMAYGAGVLPGGFTLVAIDGPMVGQRFPVGGPVEIGREGSGVRLGHDANASRRHAVVSPGMGGLAVQDLGSTNGTFVNGQRVNQASAGPGDLIKVGSTTFRVEPG